MSKRPSLAESMKSVAMPPTRLVPVQATPDVEAAAIPATPPYKAATREGKKRANVVLTPDEHRRLKRLSVDLDRTVEELMYEAVTDLFKKHGV